MSNYTLSNKKQLTGEAVFALEGIFQNLLQDTGVMSERMGFFQLYPSPLHIVRYARQRQVDVLGKTTTVISKQNHLFFTPLAITP